MSEQGDKIKRGALRFARDLTLAGLIYVAWVAFGLWRISQGG